MRSKKILSILMGTLLCFSSLIAKDCNNYKKGFDYKNTKIFKEKEKNNNFTQAIKTIIPVPYPIKAIEGKIDKNDVDYYLLYITRPSEIKLIYSGYSGFAPGIVIYNQYKQYIAIKTYASALRGEFNSQIIDFKIFKTGFYYLKISNLTNIKSSYPYKIKIIPLDLTLYPQIKNKCYKIINNLNQNTLHEIFYKEIIKKFKNMEEYKRFR